MHVTAILTEAGEGGDRARGTATGGDAIDHAPADRRGAGGPFLGEFAVPVTATLPVTADGRA